MILPEMWVERGSWLFLPSFPLSFPPSSFLLPSIFPFFVLSLIPSFLLFFIIEVKLVYNILVSRVQRINSIFVYTVVWSQQWLVTICHHTVDPLPQANCQFVLCICPKSFSVQTLSLLSVHFSLDGGVGKRWNGSKVTIYLIIKASLS